MCANGHDVYGCYVAKKQAITYRVNILTLVKHTTSSALIVEEEMCITKLEI